MRWRRKSDLPKFNPSPALVRMTYRLLLEDKAMVAVLFVGGLASTVVLMGILVPAWAFAHITPDLLHGGVIGLLVYAAALWASAFVSVLTAGVVVAAAQIRCEGGSPDVRKALGMAWSRRGPLAAWAALSTVIAMVMMILERTGVAGVIVRVLAGLTWAATTIFAVPILIAEGTGPVETAKRSGHVVRTQIGAVVRSNVRLAVPWIAAMCLTGFVTLGGIVAFAIGVSESEVLTAVAGGVVMSLAGVGFFFCAATSSALSAYLDTLLYRYATGQPVPDIDPRDVPRAFAG